MHRKGSMLILAIWAVSFLSIVTLALSSRATALLRLHSRVMEQLQSSAALNGAVQFALWKIKQDENSTFDGFDEKWKGSGSFSLYSLETAVEKPPMQLDIDWEISGENARIPLNTAPPEVFKNLLMNVTNTDEATANVIADSIADWRDADNEARPNGAEDVDYLALQPAYESLDGPIRNNEELLLIQEMTPDLFNQIQPYVTAYSDGRLNMNTAGDVVIRSLGLSSRAAEALISYRSGDDGIIGNKDDRVFVNRASIVLELQSYLPQADLHELEKLSDSDLLCVQDSHFRLKAHIQNVHDYGAVSLVAVLDKEGHPSFWEER